MMQKDTIEIYTTDHCPFCHKALEFFGQHNLQFTRHRIDDNDAQMRKWLAEKYHINGEVTVPQIIVNNERIGGYTDMMALNEAGKFPMK